VDRTLLNESPRPTRTHFLILGLCWAGWLFDFYDLMLFSFLLHTIERDLQPSSTAVSLLLGSSLAATAAGGIVFGYLADRYGRKRVLAWTIALYSMGTFLCGTAGSVEWLLVFRIITGLGVGGEWAAGHTLVAETFPPRMRARFAAVMQTGAPLGIALAAVVGTFVEPVLEARFGLGWGWRGCFFVSVTPAILVILIRRFLPESDVWLARQTAGLPDEQGRFAELMAHPALRRLFLIALVLAVADMSAYWFTYVWMPRYLQQQLGVSTTRPGVWMLVIQSGGFLGYLSYGAFADWKGRRVAYASYSLVWAAGLLAVTLFWERIAARPGLALGFLFAVGVGTGNFSGYGPMFAELFPTRLRNTAMGTAFNLARGVQFFTPFIIALVAGWYGLGSGISLAALFALFGAAWVWMLPETRGTPIGGTEGPDRTSRAVDNPGRCRA
jgi:MFS family permease